MLYYRLLVRRLLDVLRIDRVGWEEGGRYLELPDRFLSAFEISGILCTYLMSKLIENE